jgi:hypothetical protein
VSAAQPEISVANGAERQPGELGVSPSALAGKASPHRKKHRARIEHKVRGRIRMKVPHARVNPEILEHYRDVFSSIPGIRSVATKPNSGSIVIHYDPNREHEFERLFHQCSAEHLEMAQPARPDDEIDKLADKIGAEAEFLAAHSRLARATVDFCKAFDRELKLSTGNTVDLKIVLAVGLAAYTFLEIGGNAATPMWVTLALFSLNHFAELQTDHRAELEQARAEAQASG